MPNSFLALSILCMLELIPTSGGQPTFLQAKKSHVQPQALKYDNACNIPRALCANTRSTSHDKPCCETCGHIHSAERFAAQHTRGEVVGGAWGCLVLIENHPPAVHSSSKSLSTCVLAQTAGRTSNRARVPL